MTINGGQPHRVGYSGQRFKVTVHDAELDGRRTVCWGDGPMSFASLRSLETRPGWTDARCDEVTNRETGE